MEVYPALVNPDSDSIVRSLTKPTSKSSAFPPPGLVGEIWARIGTEKIRGIVVHIREEMSGEILRCAECGRAMSARACPKPERMYFYYCCSAGGFNKSHICSARRHHKAGDLEARIWDAVSKILKDPGRLRAGLDHMIEQERRNAHGDPATETEWWLGQLSEAGRKRILYQEMAAEGLIGFEELRTRRPPSKKTATPPSGSCAPCGTALSAWSA